MSFSVGWASLPTKKFSNPIVIARRRSRRGNPVKFRANLKFIKFYCELKFF
ncbi:hypothetical protein [Campylobacter sp. VBCF_01 NA2]|uniref:hypothetical protein n=1 Tax=Campylobacter sp. VBCF_01 NA2 TaxID=2983836 RepID=UPI0022E9A992|nr:hypothetical protein [Campylobacter sp. VBCF_01 NA2]WBR54774.1 hypothetical protein PF027_02590 [Campylobacter sp. VBCF_01 NA2]